MKKPKRYGIGSKKTKAGKIMKNYTIKLPEKNVEYTFLQPDGKTFNAYILIGKLENGRFQFNGRTVNGKNTKARWLTDMTATRFSYLYAKCRTKMYPDKIIEDVANAVVQEDLWQRQERIRQEQIKKDEEERRATEEKEKKLSAVLFNLPDEKKRACSLFNVNVNELAEAIIGKFSKKYPAGCDGALKIAKDCEIIKKITGVNIYFLH